jgi:hypothetical protein
VSVVGTTSSSQHTLATAGLGCGVSAGPCGAHVVKGTPFWVERVEKGGWPICSKCSEYILFFSLSQADIYTLGSATDIRYEENLYTTL